MRSLHHPWTVGLATGKTSRASFTKYVAQDAYFLRAFAKAYAYALTKAEDEESVRAFHSLIGSVLEELSFHSSYAVKWGVDLKNVSEITYLYLRDDFPFPCLAPRTAPLYAPLCCVLFGCIFAKHPFMHVLARACRHVVLDSSHSSGIPPRFNQNPPPVKATTEYVNFLLAVASDPASSVAQVLAAMVPCMRLYAFLGKVS